MKSNLDNYGLTPGLIIRNEIEKALHSSFIFDEMVKGDVIRVFSSVFSKNGSYVGKFEITIEA